MRAKHLVSIALALSLPVAGLFAQDDNQPPQGPPPGDGGQGHHRRPPPLPIIAALDANHDGIISADEIANASAALKTLDKNGDGQLTKDEYLPPHPPRGGPDGQQSQTQGQQGQQDGPPTMNGKFHPRPVPAIVAALDANHDGIISADEIANAPAALKTLDKNGDGQLTMDEIMGPRPHRGPGDGNGPGDGQGPPPPDGNDNGAPPHGDKN